MNIGPIQIEKRQSQRALRLKESVLASFYEPAPAVRARLGEFKLNDWQRAKYWLDVSGLSLYFLDRLIALNLESCVPATFVNQLRTHWNENRDRCNSLFAELTELARTLQQRNIECAVLKGISLPIESVPENSLRNQMDIDILVRNSDAELTKNCLATFGYGLDAVSGSVNRFLASPQPTLSYFRDSTCSSICVANTRGRRGFWSTGGTFARAMVTPHSGQKWSRSLRGSRGRRPQSAQQPY
jgi:hypothetical protein